MTFLTPFFISGLVLLGIPLIIHLIRRRRLQVVKWAAMEFLRLSQQKQRRRLRIEELILLALRMLIVTLAVLAFARPVLNALGIPLLSQNTHVYSVIVLDNSFSMGAKGKDGKTSFERAQAAAGELLTRVLKDGDAVSLVLLSDKPEALIDSPTFDRNLVSQRIYASHLSDRSTDYLAAAQAANRLLKNSKIPVKEVYWITDDQADGWAASKSKTETAKNTWNELGKMARVTWISAGADESDRENLEVETPTLGSELVTTQLATRIEARIVNYGSKPRNRILVNLTVDGSAAESKEVSVPPGGSAVAPFVHTFVKAGTHICTVALNDPIHIDALARDNTAPLVVRVRERINVLVQDMRPSSNPSQSESFYIVKAMAPDNVIEGLAPKLREGGSLTGVTLRDYDAIVITGLASLSSTDRSALSEYVKAGGGLMLFPGPGTDTRKINSELSESGLLPARLGSRKTLGEKSAVQLNPNTIKHPALTMFKDTATLDITSALFNSYYPLEPVNDDANLNSIRVMLRFGNNDPAFVERQVGLGHVILAASGAGRVWNDLPLKPSYVPLVYQLMFYLGQGATSHRNLRLDEPLFLSLPLKDANKSVRVADPNGQTTGQNSSLDARGVTFNYAKTDHAGFYKLTVAGSGTTDAFAVGLPAGESNLAYSDPKLAAPLAGLLGNLLTVVKSPGDLRVSVNRARYGSEIWYPLIITVICLLFLESFLARIFGRRG